MREWWRGIRWRIAYFLAHDWIDDLEYRFSVFLCEQTGGMMSKCYYTVEAMRAEANDFQMRLCEECEYYQIAERENNENSSTNNE